MFCGPAEAVWVPVTAAVSEVVLPGVVGLVASAVAPHITVEPLAKFVPVTVSVREPVPATTELGVSPFVPIAGPLTVNVIPLETPVGFFTVTVCDPAEASWSFVTFAVSEVAPT
jgi:hypothetical protein